MSIKVNTYQLQSKSAYAASIASQLKEDVNQVSSIYYSLDSKVKSRYGIGSSIRSLQQRIEKAQQKMYNISSFLSKAADKYTIAEAVVATRGASIGAVASNNVGAAAGAASVGAQTGGAQGKLEEKKWYQSNWFKLAVGAVVVGVAVAAAVVLTAVASPIVAGIAVGAAIGAGIGAVVGGVTGGVVSKMQGGSFWDGAADGFMWGAVGGAFSGGIGATGVGIVGTAVAEGAANSAIYAAGQMLQNDGEVTVTGLATSFVVGAGFSAIVTVASNKISGIISKNVSKNMDEAVPNTGSIDLANPTSVPKDNPLSQGNIVGNVDIKKLTADELSVIIKNSPEVGDELIEKISAEFGTAIKSNPLRQEYENAVQGLLELGKRLKADGLSDEAIARQLHQARRDLGVKYKDLSPQLLKEYIYDVNIGRYQDPLGPTIEYLLNVKGKTWADIIDSATRPNPDVNSLLGGFKNWLRAKNGL